MPALWQVQMVKPTLFSNFLWDGCEIDQTDLLKGRQIRLENGTNLLC
jgi:hypothetical protein